MNSRGGATISSLLGELDIIAGGGSETASGRVAPQPAHRGFPVGGEGKQQAEKSAIALLREHREHEKERQLLAASIVLPPKPVLRSNPLLDQIGQSTTESPTYWKTAPTSNASHKKYSSSTKGQVSKAVQKKRQKGENYKDRLKEKIVSKGGGRR